LRRRLDDRGAVAEVRSAGLRADPGGPSDGLVLAAADWGVDLRGHRSTALGPGLAAGADLVLTMEHHQVTDVVATAPDAWPHTFTVKEIVRRATERGARTRDEPFPRWVGRMHAGRTRLGLVGAWRDDVPDPAGLPESELARTIAELDALVDHLAEVGWPRRRR
jgi:protein-tyrosine phosphatase